MRATAALNARPSSGDRAVAAAGAGKRSLKRHGLVSTSAFPWLRESHSALVSTGMICHLRGGPGGINKWVSDLSTREERGRATRSWRCAVSPANDAYHSALIPTADQVC